MGTETDAFLKRLRKEAENTHDFILEMLRELAGKVSDDEENRYRENC